LSSERLAKILAVSNVQLIGDYESTKKPADFQCLTCGSKFTAKLRKAKDTWFVLCRECVSTTKKSSLKQYLVKLDFVLSKNEAVWISGEVTAKNSLLTIACAHGHEFSRTLEAIVESRNFCSACYLWKYGYRKTKHQAKLPDESETRELLNLQGWELQSPVAQMSRAVTVDCMVCGRKLEAQLSKLVLGARVCQCTKDKRKQETLRARIFEVTSARLGKLISEVPTLLSDKAEFECSKGHRWNSSVSSILGQGTWCPGCAGNLKLDIRAIQDVVAARGGKLLSSEYKGVDATYKFQCNLGHTWTNRFSKIKKGQWCPTCSKAGISEEIARTTFEQIFGTKFPKRRPKWLRNERGFQMELDGFSEKLQLAFEYQGRQHYEDIGIFSSNFEQRKSDDLFKAQLCRQHGITLIYLTDQDDHKDFARLVKERLELTNFDSSQIDFATEVDLNQAYIRENRLPQLVALLKPKNIRVLSTKWVSTSHDYDLECLTCGHKWSAKGNMFFNTRRVAGCRKCAIAAVAGKNKHSFEVLAEYAELFGGTVLSETYEGRNHIYLWKCPEGHEFEANFNNLKFRNLFCPQCDGRQTRKHISQEDAAALYREVGLELLVPFTNRSRHLGVRCLKCGEESLQSLDSVRPGRPACKPCQFQKKREVAESIMARAGVRPLEPFTSNTAHWRCECLTCHQEITPVVVNVRRGQGACLFCGRDKLRGKRRTTKDAG
jgi:formylmethanofuran dehydrogenase subunit E